MRLLTFVCANFVRYLCFHCSNDLSLTSSEVLPPVIFLHISPFLHKGGMLLEGLGMPLGLPEGFPLLGPAGGVEEPLVARSVHASLHPSPRFIRGLGIQELLSCGKLLLFMSDWLSLLISVCSTRWWGGRVFGVFWLCSRLLLPSHLCTLDEVVRRVRFFRVPLLLVFLPGLPIFSLRGREVIWARSWLSGFRWRSCCSLCRSACRARLRGRDAVSVDRLVGYFPLCCRCVSVGGLRAANVFPVFALVVSVGPVVFFLTTSDPSDTALVCPIAAVATIVHGNSFSLLARGSPWPLSVARSLSPFFMTASVHGGGCCPPLSSCGVGWAAGEPGVSGGGCRDVFCPPSFRYLWNVAAVSPLLGECCFLISACS